MKYIDANKIRAEIERRYHEHSTREYTDEAGVELDSLLAFLDTLEEPVSEGLEKEIDAYYKEWDGNCRYAQTARHFAEWGAKHLKK